MTLERELKNVLAVPVMHRLATAKVWMSFKLYNSDTLLIDSRNDVMGYNDVPSKRLISSEISLMLKPKFKRQGPEIKIILIRINILKHFEFVLESNVVE